MSRLRHLKFLPNYVKFDLIRSLVDPIYNYDEILYHGYSIHGTIADQVRLEVSNNSCIRFVLNLKSRDHISEHRNRLGVLTLFNRRKLHIAVFMFKVLKGMAPDYISRLIDRNENSTRRTNELKLVRVKTERDKLMFRYGLRFCEQNRQTN